jgi:hypothetical protein
MAYTKYSLTPADNNAAPPNGAPEGMLPSAVNDTMRDMMAQIRDVGDGIRGGTYTMTAPVITGGSITGVALSGNTLTNPVITGGSINNTTVGATTRSTGAFTTLASNGATTFTAGTASTSTTTGTAVITGGLGVSGRINAANFDGIVGANTAAAGNFTTLGATGVATFSAGTVSAPAITTTGDTNTGIFFPAADTIAFTEGGAESMRIDAGGNLGLGVTPSAWGSSAKVLQINNRTSVWNLSDNSYFTTNSYFNGTNSIYIATAPATMYSQQNDGAHKFYVAPSGTAGNAITFTQAMTLDASGRLGIGVTSPTANLEVKNTGTSTTVGENIIYKLVSGGANATTTIHFTDAIGYNNYISGGFGQINLQPVTAGTSALQVTGTTTALKSSSTSTTIGANVILRCTSGGSGADNTIHFTDALTYNAYISATAGKLSFQPATSGTVAAEINANGIGIGGASPSSGTGITFPATQSASSDANTLDDYEEGTWTPNQGSGLTVVGAFSSAGVYTKIGNLVYVRGYVQGGTSVSVGAGGVISANLPFSNGGDACGGNATTYNVNLTSGVYIQSNTSFNATSALTASIQIIFGFTYRV